VIESQGVTHRITFSVDPVSHEPRLDHQRADDGDTQGTEIALYMPVSAGALRDGRPQ